MNALVFAACLLAYSAPGRYAQDPAQGGGGGRFFTGSPRDGFTCEVCHTGAAPGPEVVVNGLPKDGYEPGRTYSLAFEWTAQDFDTSTEIVTLVTELQTDAGEPAGVLEAVESPCVTGVPAQELFELDDGRAVLTMSPCGATKLRARWTAPHDACDAVLYIAAMQGDESEDPTGDGLTLRTRRIAPEIACSEPAASGCRVGSQGSAWSLLLIVLLRRRRSCDA